MAVNLWAAPTQPFQTTLNGSMGATDVTFALTSITGLQAPGILVIDRQDGQGNNTFHKMEFVSFTGISGNAVTGVVRGLAGSNAIVHNSGAVVEAYLTVTQWKDLQDFLLLEHVSTGQVKTLSHVRQITATGVSSASGLRGDVVIVPGTNLNAYALSGASGYNFIKLEVGVNSVFLPEISSPTAMASGTNMMPLLLIKDTLNVKSISVVFKSPTSNATAVLDINKNFSTMFTDQNTRLMVPQGGTYASTASIGIISLTGGNVISVDYDNI